MCDNELDNKSHRSYKLSSFVNFKEVKFLDGKIVTGDRSKSSKPNGNTQGAKSKDKM